VSRRLVNITLDNLSDLPFTCRRCIFWELDPVAAERAGESGDTALEKEAWLSDTLLEWGSCGQVAYVDGVPAGYALYAPAAYVPRAVAFPTSPISADAILLMTGRILPEFAGTGLGRMLIQTVARETVRRGVRAIEAFGRTGTVSSLGSGDGTGSSGCLIPADYLRAVGFKTVRPHPRVPRLRLDIRSTQTWREDVENAIERLFGSIQSPVLSR
jgi:GNAT superfamily N-acetyltransferase